MSVIPGRRAAANPESRWQSNFGIPDASAMRLLRNDKEIKDAERR
jgi:hypothetical protein